MKHDYKTTPRSRLGYAALMLSVVVLGLSSRKFAVWLPHFVAVYAGDTLWALLVFLGIGFLWPRLATLRVAGLALTFAVCIEFSQLYHAPWLDALRHTLPGHLVLGDTFVASDLLCYTVGVSLGAVGEMLKNKKGGPM